MRIVKATVAVMATGVMFSSFASPTAAFTQRLDDLVSHFLDCKLLLLTDLEAHARECGGGTMPSSFQSLVDPVPGGAAPVVVTTPPKEECSYEEGDEQYWCECKDEQQPA